MAGNPLKRPVKQIPDRILPDGELTVFIENMMQKQPVIGPRERLDQPGHICFDQLKRPEDFVTRYTTTTLPPKKAFFDPTETLFHFDSLSMFNVEIMHEDTPFALVGVHPCDLAALEELDRAYGEPPAAGLWEENRKRALIAGIDCLPDEYCFCDSMGTGDARYPCDVFLTQLKEGFLLEVYTPEGEKALTGLKTRRVLDRELEEAGQRYRQKMESQSARLTASVEQVAEILRRDDLTELWQEIAERCYSCGSCNITCPACFCFDMHDEFDLSLRGGRRYRSWDSCQLPEFALIAGGENMRPERWQRVRHRWNRKFNYLYQRFGLPYCTGCGRCSRACTADINMVDITNQIIRLGRKEVKGGNSSDSI